MASAAMIMPVIVRRRAKAQPVRTVTKLSKVGQVITQESGCSRSRNERTRDTGASLLNALVLQPRIVREAPLVPERLFLLPKKCESRTKEWRRMSRASVSQPAAGGLVDRKECGDETANSPAAQVTVDVCQQVSNARD